MGRTWIAEKQVIVALHAAAFALALAPAALAQQAEEQRAEEQQRGEPEVAQQCLADLRAFNERAVDEGYWLAGRRTGWGATRDLEGYGVADPHAMPPGPQPGVPPGTPLVEPGARTPAPGLGEAGGVGVPDAAFMGVISPRHEMRTLFAAAEILGYRGHDDGCRLVLSELRQVFDDHIARLREAGLEPADIMTWRQERLVAAAPVDEVPAVFHSDTIVGSDIRNLHDTYLGSIEDVVVDPETGEISHLLVSRGGFLGIGQEHYAVRWQDLRAAPLVATFVLDVPEAVVENAPQVDPDLFDSPEIFRERRQPIDAYWEEQLSG
jgi:sporulation protein YlmC with PRC-barrel domain